MTSPRPDLRSFLDLLACQELSPLTTAESRGLALRDHAGAFLTAPGASGFRTAGHLLGDRAVIERFLGVDDLGRALADAMDHPAPPQAATCMNC